MATYRDGMLLTKEDHLREMSTYGDIVGSAVVQPNDVEAASWAIAEIELLRQQLADANAEIGGLRHDLDIAHEHRRFSERECDRLRTELLQQPPTLEWLRETFGSHPEITIGSTGYETYRWSCGVRYHTAYRRVTGVTGLTLETRAAVLAAVAATKETSDG